MNNINNIYITTNQTCNLNCVYCYEHDKSNQETFNIELAKSTILKVLSQPSNNETIISFHGGEPFLSFAKIKSLCEWAWRQNFQNKFLFFATSNGTLIHGNIQNWLEENKKKFIVGLSLDGTREMHNINRSNSFDRIDIPFFVKTWPTQGVKMTVSPKTISNLAEGVIYIHECGFKDVKANLAEMIDWSDEKFHDIYRKELRKLSEYYLAHRNIQPCSLFDVRFVGVLNNDIRKWCGAGTEMHAIDIDGRKYPCHLFFESVCGKEKSLAAQNIDFSNPEQYISKSCKDCKLLPICPTCYGSNYIERGAINLRDPNLCELHKIRFSEVALYHYRRIVSSDIQALSEEERYRDMRILEAIEKLKDVLDLENLK